MLLTRRISLTTNVKVLHLLVVSNFILVVTILYLCNKFFSSSESFLKGETLVDCQFKNGPGDNRPWSSSCWIVNQVIARVFFLLVFCCISVFVFKKERKFFIAWYSPPSSIAWFDPTISIRATLLWISLITFSSFEKSMNL